LRRSTDAGLLSKFLMPGRFPAHGVFRAGEVFDAAHNEHSL
jgi:hypothetical protein